MLHHGSPAANVYVIIVTLSNPHELFTLSSSHIHTSYNWIRNSTGYAARLDRHTQLDTHTKYGHPLQSSILWSRSSVIMSWSLFEVFTESTNTCSSMTTCHYCIVHLQPPNRISDLLLPNSHLEWRGISLQSTWCDLGGKLEPSAVTWYSAPPSRPTPREAKGGEP